MSKYIKKIVTGLWATLLVTMIIILAAFLVTQLPFVQRWAARCVAAKASEATGLPVGIERLRYSPFSTVGVEGVRISGHDSLPMISICRAKAYISILSFLEGDITIHEIEADSVSIGLRQTGDGTWNIADLASKDSVESSPNVAFKIGSVRANHCDVVAYPWNKKKFEVDNLSLNICDISKSGNKFGATLSDFSFDATSWDAHFSMGGRFAASGDTLAVGSARISLGGCVAKVDTLAAIVDSTGLRYATVDIPSVRATGLMASKFFGKEIPTVGATLKGVYDNGDIKLTQVNMTAGSASNVTIKGTAHLDTPQNGRPSLTRIKTTLSGCLKPSDITAFIPESENAETLDKIPVLPFEGIVSANATAGVAHIDINSELGKATAYITAATYDDWSTIDANAKLETDLTPSKITNGTLTHLASQISATGRINMGTGNWLRYIDMHGSVDRIDFLNHSISGIKFTGTADSTEVNGGLTINDHVAKLRMFANAQLDGITPILEISAKVDSAQMNEIAPTVFTSPSNLGFEMYLRTAGLDLRTSETRLAMSNIALRTDTDEIAIRNLTAILSTDGEMRTLNVESDVAAIDAKGNFDLPGLIAELQTQANLAMPDLIDEPIAARRHNPHPDAPQQVDIEATFANYGRIVNIFTPDIELSDTLNIRGHVDSEGHFAWARLETPSVAYGDFKLDSIGISLVSNDGQAEAAANVYKFRAPIVGEMHNLRIDAECEENQATADIEWGTKISNTTWTRHGNKAAESDAISGFINIEAEVEKEEDDSRTWYVGIDKSKLPIGDGTWNLDSCRIAFATDYIDVGNFNAFSGEHSVWASGRASKNAEDTLQVKLNKIVLEDLLNISPKAKYSLAGDLTLTASASAIMGSPSFAANAQIDRFIVNGDNLDKFTAATNYQAQSDTLGFDLAIATGGKSRARAKGLYNFKSNYLFIPFDIDSLSTGFLNFYLDNCIDHWSGTTSGTLMLHGPADALALDSRLKMNDDNKFRVMQTDVWYYIQSNDSLVLSPTSMDFLDIRFVDDKGREGIFGGSISHDMFSNLDMHLVFTIKDDMLLLKTDAKSSPSYYGNVYGSGKMYITGPTSNVEIDIKAKTGEKSSFAVAPNAKTDISDASHDYIFETTGDINTIDRASILGTGTSASLELTITPEAELIVMVDQTAGNKLICRGTGKITVDIGRTGEITMHGSYSIESGTYHFAALNVIDKRFTIDNGSAITWDGGPYDAEVNVSATYTASASMSNLMGGMSFDGSSDSKRRVPVKCKIDIRGNLMKPDIKFRIEIPSSQSFSQYTFDQYVNTQEDISRQVLSLLTAGQFAPIQETSSQSSQSQSYLGMAASEVLSNKLSSMISQNDKNIDVGVGYRPGDEMSNEEYTLAISTQAFGDKVTLSGNIGYGRDASGSTSDDGTLIGDFDLEVKLNKKGNIRAKAYTHSNNDVIYETSPTTQGIGISYQEEFDSFRELFKSYWHKLFHRKKNKELEADTNPEQDKDQEPGKD